MSDLPTVIQRNLQSICIDKKHPAFLCVDFDGSVTDAGGDLDWYALSSFGKNGGDVNQIDFLAEMFPLNGKAAILPCVFVGSDRFAEVHLFTKSKKDWVILLDATEEAEALWRTQQIANELNLLRRKESKLLAAVRKSQEDLLTILNQQKLITVIVDENNVIEFLSRTGHRLSKKEGRTLVGLPWHDLFPFAERDLARINETLALPNQERKPVIVHLRSPHEVSSVLEFDVRDDPREPAKRIFYIYDKSEVFILREQLKEKAGFSDMIGRSESMLQVYQMIKDFSGFDTTVLVTGETGTGKELVARAIHANSARRDGPFIAVNSSGLADSLINSQLFGYRKGSFTGATRDQIGLFEAANTGTIFMDEIGDIPLNEQRQVLRVLEEKEVLRIGENTPRKIDVRIIVATHKDLAEEVRQGRFRQDLLYRIQVARIHLPSLRDRREDIPLLIDSFLKKSQATTGKVIEEIDPDTMKLLVDHDWPGNVRELRNAIEFSVIRCKGSVLTPADLPPEIVSRQDIAKDDEVENEKQWLERGLMQARGKRMVAADLLGVSRATLYRLMKKHNLTRKN